jgi:hypothetical protein
MKEVIGNLDFMMSKKDPIDVGPLTKKLVLIHTIKEELEMGDDRCLEYYLNFLRTDDRHYGQDPMNRLHDHYLEFCQTMTVEYVLQRLSKLRPHTISTYQENIWISHIRYLEEECDTREYFELIKQLPTVKNNYQEVLLEEVK